MANPLVLQNKIFRQLHTRSLSKNLGVSPDAHFLLLSIVHQCWDTNGFSDTTKNLARKFEMGETAFGKSVKELLGKELLIRYPLYDPLQPGRPRYHYDLSSVLRALIKNSENSVDLHHKPDLSGLFTPIKVTSTATEQPQMKRTELIVLCTLLGNANKCGVVKHLTLSDLAEMTGLNNSQALKTIKSLQKMGEILQYLPGLPTNYSKKFETDVFHLSSDCLATSGENRSLEYTIHLIQVESHWWSAFEKLLTISTAQEGQMPEYTTKTTQKAANSSEMLFGTSEPQRAQVKRVFFTILDEINQYLSIEFKKWSTQRSHDLLTYRVRSSMSCKKTLKNHIPSESTESETEAVTIERNRLTNHLLWSFGYLTSRILQITQPLFRPDPLNPRHNSSICLYPYDHEGDIAVIAVQQK